MDNNDEDNKKPYKVSVYIIFCFYFPFSDCLPKYSLVFSTPEILYSVFCILAKQLIRNLINCGQFNLNYWLVNYFTELILQFNL